MSSFACYHSGLDQFVVVDNTFHSNEFYSILDIQSNSILIYHILTLLNVIYEAVVYYSITISESLNFSLQIYYFFIIDVYIILLLC